jgi:hypothetical protein
LALDRTNWKYGTRRVNILTLSIVMGNASIPIFWQTLNRQGNSALAKKEAINERYVKTFGRTQIKYFCADREFDGQELVKYLDKKKVSLRLRVKVSMSSAKKFVETRMRNNPRSIVGN